MHAHVIERGAPHVLANGIELLVVAAHLELRVHFEPAANTTPRQFRVADLSRLVNGAQETGSPVVIGYRLKRADPPLRLIYATLYRVANRIWFGLSVRDVDCAAKLFRRDALRGISVHSDGAFFSAELLIRLRLAGVHILEVGVPHYPRTAGSPTGARLSVITRAVRDFWSLRIGLWVNRSRALARGRALLNK